MLAQVLLPWRKLVEAKVPAAKAWTFCNDRSVKVCRSRVEDSQAARALQAAIAETTKLDEAIGLKENAKKR